MKVINTRETDIEAVIRLVHQQMPEVEVNQVKKTWPADDDSLWWFLLPGVEKNLQIESYSCPFLVETNEQCCEKALRAETVDEAVFMIVIYLKSVREGNSIRLSGVPYWPIEPADTLPPSSDQ